MNMVQVPPDADDTFRSHRDRNMLIRKVKSLLRGSGLDVRELQKQLVISNPGHPEKGRIYIPYASAEVSLRRPIWEYLGHLEGQSGDHDPELRVNAAKIIGTLGGQAKNPT
jgi:hypothetical protein